MMKRWLIGLATVLALAGPRLTFAHGGHTHKVMGTVAAVTATQLDIKTKDGKTVTIVLDNKTTFLHGKAKMDATMLKAGDRVVADVQGTKTLTAEKVQMGSRP